ncbi:transposase [Kineococcus sp. SYSU DK005]|uniref:transposase n=1 Tax=Kineococcus sp. SYSU DK005 TaxID=3383126 RepID=UPI003D7EA9BF
MGVISASQASWIEPFTGISPQAFARLLTQLRRAGADGPGRGRPWKLPLQDRVLLVAAYWRTNLTLRQIAPLFGVSKSAADRMIHDLAPRLALAPRRKCGSDSVLIVDGTLVPTRDRSIAASSKNYRYSTNHQVVIDADTHLVVALGQPLPGNRNDSKAWVDSGVHQHVRGRTVIADGGYLGTGLLIPHRRTPGEDLPGWKEAHNTDHRRVRARVEHTLARLKCWKVLRDCRLRGSGVQHAMSGIARLYNLGLA